MRVILLSDVRGSGKIGDIVTVSDCFAKNCLYPNKLAKDASTQALKELDDAKKSLERQNEIKKKQAEEIKAILNERTIKIVRKGGEDGKLFGAVTSKDIAAQIKADFGVEIDKHKIALENSSMKQFGSSKFSIKIFPGIVAQMLVMVSES